MPGELSVHFLPSLVDTQDLAGATVVVIDVLRATSTIATALANGAAAVFACAEVAEAIDQAARLPAAEVLRGGERAGLPIEGFDRGNSPAEYTPDAVAGKTIVFTTTNGTRAIHHCRYARQVLLGSFVNLSAIVQALQDQTRVHLLCAGTGGQLAREDIWFAGMVVDALGRDAAAHSARAAPSDSWQWNDDARIARADARGRAWSEAGRHAPADPNVVAALRRDLGTTRGGRKLVRLGLADDVAAAARIDAVPVVPMVDVDCWRITLR